MPTLPINIPSPGSIPDTEALVLNRVAQLEQMTVANGCHADYSVRRLARGENQPEDFSIYVVADGPFRGDLEPGKGPTDQFGTGVTIPAKPSVGEERVIQPFRIECYRHLPDLTGAPETDEEKIAVDKILAESSAWIQLFWLADRCCDGTAADTWYVDEQRDLSSNPPLVSLSFEARISRPTGQPFISPTS